MIEENSADKFNKFCFEDLQFKAIKILFIKRFSAVKLYADFKNIFFVCQERSFIFNILIFWIFETKTESIKHPKISLCILINFIGWSVLDGTMIDTGWYINFYQFLKVC